VQLAEDLGEGPPGHGPLQMLGQMFAVAYFGNHHAAVYCLGTSSQNKTKLKAVSHNNDHGRIFQRTVKN